MLHSRTGHQNTSCNFITGSLTIDILLKLYVAAFLLLVTGASSTRNTTGMSLHDENQQVQSREEVCKVDCVVIGEFEGRYWLEVGYWGHIELSIRG